MLKAAKRKQSGLGKNAGVEFVETLFGRDRELDKTEKFMQNVRLFNLRFDANSQAGVRIGLGVLRDEVMSGRQPLKFCVMQVMGRGDGRCLWEEWGSLEREERETRAVLP
ncbi:hypothetical protein NM208_g16351 [Fusarium decemcellulare]|uniref:Uncharacterized protein n=1 Tax=Fusarium decemcellulare TaxID=57161 RepID=A0ACC1RCB6_9HYPO|nr:hypothetical protein NM208_g16351 [Fusarium decemcellulare]